MNHKRGIARIRGTLISASIIPLKGTTTNVKSAEIQSLDLDVNCEIDTLSTSKKQPFSCRIVEGIGRKDTLVRVQRACRVVKETFVTERNKVISVNRFDKC